MQKMIPGFKNSKGGALKLAMLSLLALAGCDGGVGLGRVDLSSGFNLRTSTPVQQTAPRPEPDARGVISYPSYQVAVAQPGDTVTDLATRIGLSPSELAKYNGLAPNSPLRDGELLALPRRVATNKPSGVGEITAIATSAIDKAAQSKGTPSPSGNSPGNAIATRPAKSVTQTGGQPLVEPIRHRVERGETAYSIARLYNVSVTALASWNRLGPNLAVYEGEQLLIPIVEPPAPKTVRTTRTTSLPGQSSATPTPPSASKPLPRKVVAAIVPPSPDLGKYKTKADSRKFLAPVQGKVISGYSGKKGGNEGIDIAAPAGTTVKAAENGEVALVSRSIGAGTIILLRHAGNIYTVYSNVTNVTLKKGQKVQRGQRLGTVAKGNPSFLHFEVRRGTQSVDPAPYL